MPLNTMENRYLRNVGPSLWDGAKAPHHPGNVRAVVSDADSVEQENHYYPFGILMGESRGGDVQRRKFGGKELDREWGLDLFDFEARRFDGMRFTQPDPLAEKYPDTSPYAFCLNNPLRNSDPTGMDIWSLNNEGRVVKYEKTDKTDQIRLVDSEGNVRKDDDGKELTLNFKYGTIEKFRSIEQSDGDTFDYFQVRGDDNGKTMFEFLSKNISVQSLVEFSWVATGVSGKKGLNFINCGHEAGKAPAISALMIQQLQYDYYIRSIVHCHPQGDVPGSGDLDFKNDANHYHLKKYKKSIPQYIYYVKNPKAPKYIRF